MIDFRKLGEFCARHGCAEQYLRNVESRDTNPYPGKMLVPGNSNQDAFSCAFVWRGEEMEYWNEINDLWMQELKE